jgi:hypothetical protein
VFGISFGKLVLLGLLVAAVWFGFRWLQAQGRDRSPDPAAKKPPPGPAAAARGAAPAGTAPGGAEELTKCPVCATYVVRGAPRCGRADCPAALHG